METLKAINIRKSIRSFKDKQIRKEELQTILHAANKAPTPGPLHLTVIQDETLLEDINDTSKLAMLNSGNELLEARANTIGYEPLYGAPTLVIISAPEKTFGADTAACSATIMILAATDLGVGSCYTVSPTIGIDAAKSLKNKIDLPSGYEPQCAVLLGYSDNKDEYQAERSNSNIKYL